MNIFSFQIKNAIVADLKSKGLQANQHSIKKTMQLYETKSSRHSVVIVGGTQSGKTVAWKTLQGALISLFRKGDYDFNNVKVFPLNPKALSLGELYGEFELGSNDWTDGVLSSIARNACNGRFYFYLNWGRRGRERMVDGFTTTYAISAYHH